jgi:hypothetical protein
LDNRLLEDNAILVLDRNIFHLAVPFTVTRAVMLDLDDYAADFTHWEIEDVLIVPTEFAGLPPLHWSGRMCLSWCFSSERSAHGSY